MRACSAVPFGRELRRELGYDELLPLRRTVARNRVWCRSPCPAILSARHPFKDQKDRMSPNAPKNGMQNMSAGAEDGPSRCQDPRGF